MAASNNRNEPSDMGAHFCAEHKAQQEYFTSFDKASLENFPTRYAEELAIRSGRDYSTWILSAADCDVFMRDLLDRPNHNVNAPATSHRQRKS